MASISCEEAFDNAERDLSSINSFRREVAEQLDWLKSNQAKRAKKSETERFYVRAIEFYQNIKQLIPKEDDAEYLLEDILSNCHYNYDRNEVKKVLKATKSNIKYDRELREQLREQIKSFPSMAAKLNSLSLGKVLKEAGFSLNSHQEDSASPLKIALTKRNYEYLQFMFDNSVSVDGDGLELPPLFIALKGTDSTFLEFMLKQTKTRPFDNMTRLISLDQNRVSAFDFALLQFKSDYLLSRSRFLLKTLFRLAEAGYQYTGGDFSSSENYKSSDFNRSTIERPIQVSLANVYQNIRLRPNQPIWLSIKGKGNRHWVVKSKNYKADLTFYELKFKEQTQSEEKLVQISLRENSQPSYFRAQTSREEQSVHVMKIETNLETNIALYVLSGEQVEVIDPFGK